MLVSIYYMTLNLLKKSHFGVKSKYLPPFTQVKMDVITQRYEICKPLVVYRFYCKALYHSKMRRHVIKGIFF